MSKRKFFVLVLAVVLVLFLLESELLLARGGTNIRKNGSRIYDEYYPCLGPPDFEATNQDSCLRLTHGSKGKLSQSTEKAKHGSSSLKWEGEASTILQYEKTNGTIASGKDVIRGGIKVWLYKETPSVNGKLEIRLHGNKSPERSTIKTVTINLGFKGWRGIWIAYSKFKTAANSRNSLGALTRVQFYLQQKDTIYIDLLEFVSNMSEQSRDKIVPPSSVVTYDPSSFWLQTYRWSQQPPTPLPTKIDPSKTQSLEHVESRLKNWYFSEDKSSFDFKSFQEARWNSLVKNSFEAAHKEYDRLHFKTVKGNKIISGPPLFCTYCKLGAREYSDQSSTRKFGFIMTKLLLPLGMEYHFRSRDKEIQETAQRVSSALNSGDTIKEQWAISKIALNPNDRTEFWKHLLKQGKPYTQEKVVQSIKHINKIRLYRINSLLDFVEDQGWADGSAIGSLMHEMNQDGVGFMHTIFLLKDSLRVPSNKKRLQDLIKTAKWYCSFGEVYQFPKFEFSGTTADRMTTVMLFRLMIVLIMPADTDTEKKERQRDMDALKRWMDNALTINKSFGGVIKPDYTGFHHKAFYASAYTPQALHTAAQVQYLLEGTDFALSSTSKSNLRKALEVLRLTAVKYSTPSSVNGRFPHFFSNILARILPAYAYISVSFPGSLSSTPPKRISIPDVEGTEMFLRLYDITQKPVNNYLCDGRIRNHGKFYINSLGSLEIMRKVVSKAASLKIAAEPSPEGHWSKNFAAFSVHRRKDWAVTVKGFNNFVLDFEAEGTHNPYGMFASHGAMLVANSEETLKVHNVRKGWDWSKIPGATTVPLKPDEMKLVKPRNFSPLSVAGGVTFQGTESLCNGAFGMDFHQPDYELSEPGKKVPQQLFFKKSVFFYQNLIVCLGSNIRLTNAARKKAQTTLFQDRLVRRSSFIEMNGAKKNYSNLFAAETPAIAQGKSYTTLVDTKGNSYYVPQSSASSLKVHVKDQAQLLTARYATAWFEHSAASPAYEYAVYVKTTSYESDTESLWKEQNRNGLYTVEKQDDKAHVVKFQKSFIIPSIRLNNPVFGYVIFDSSASLPGGGPIKRVSKKCLLMAEETTHSLHLSISYPNLDFNVSKTFKLYKDVGRTEFFHTESNENRIKVTLNQDVQTTLPKNPWIVHGAPRDYSPSIRVVPSSSPSGKGNVITFDNLKNGFSVEVTLKK